MMKTLNKKTKTKTKTKTKKTASRITKKNRKTLKRVDKKIATVPTLDILTTVSDVKTKKLSEKQYFTQDTENAIILFNKEENMDVRDKIYNDHIKYPFEKLVENVFNTFKFSYFDVGVLDVQKETLSHLVANISKFQEGKGKAFSYFSIIAKHYLIFNNNSNYKRFNQHVDIGEENEENTVRLQTVDKHYKDTENREFIDMMIKYWDCNIKNIFPKSRDLKIAQAVVELFRNSDRLDFFNKKALYLYIREISSCKTQQITKIINRMKEYQSKITNAYIEEGVI